MNRRGVMIVMNDIVHDSRVIKMAVAMRKIFDEVTLIGMSKDAKPKPASQKFFVEGVECLLFPNHLKRVPRNSEEGDEEYLDRRQAEGLDLLTEDIASFVSANRPHCIHTHDMYPVQIGRALKERSLEEGWPTYWIHDVHEFVAGCSHIPAYRQQFALSLERQHLHHADCVVTVTDALARKLHDLYPSLPAVAVIHNTPERYPADTRAIPSVRSLMHLPADKPLAVYAGQVKEKRGVDKLPAVLAQLPDLQLAIVTNAQGEYKDLLLAAFDDFGVTDRVSFLPYVPHHQVPRYLAGSDIGLIPIENYGNASVSLPNKLFEYVMAGLPVVAHRLDALSTFMDQHAVGSVTNFDHPSQAAESIRGVLSERFDRSTFSSVRSAIIREFAWEAQERHLLELYIQAVGAGGVRVIDAASGAPPVSGKIRVLHGLTEAAGQPSALAKALDELPGITAKSLQIRMPKQGRYPDYLHPVRSTMSPIPMAQTLRAAAASEFDVYHLHARGFFLDPIEASFPTGSDLLLLKASGKKVVVHFRGSEARVQSKFKASSPYHFVDDDDDKKNANYTEEAKLRFIKMVNAVADAVLVVDPELQTYLPNAQIVERAINLDEWLETPPSNTTRPLVVHAPSLRGVKG
ncbi:MAG: glycosyltransferase family 4 protein, partial [Parvularcula sp.]|nr:glycosyltransferase family 4 protein [Parvularcula sp.]